MADNNLPRKERYFDSSNIDTVAQTMLSELRSKVRIHELEFVPDRSALLVLDMQKYFLDKNSHAFVPSVQVIMPRIVSLMSMYRKIARPVIATRHLNTDDNSGMMSIWWRDMIRQDDPLSVLMTEIDDLSTTTIVKSQYDAFHGTDLEKLLRDSDVDQVVVTGVMTHLCCETTARSAFMRGFNVFVPIDGTATYNIDFHRATMLNLSHGFAIPTLVNEIESCLKQVDHENM